MRNNNKNKPDYAALERKIYIRVAVTAGLAFLTVIILSGTARNNKIGDIIVAFLRSAFGMSDDAAHHFYWSYIRNNAGYILFATALVFFVILSRFLLSQFARYFNEINGGLDTLAYDKGGEIRLSPEMLSMERKLNAIKQTLDKREHDAKQAEQRKNDLVTYLAHDIKTPLTSVVGYLSLLDESPDMPAEQKAKYIHIALDKAVRLEQLIEQFFEITRYNLQTIALSKENIDLRYMLAQMADEFYPLLSAKGKRVTLRAPEDLRVYGDPDKLARVFNNILRNAAEYGTDNSVVDITAGISGGMVSIAFTNDGNIPREKLAPIFDKFYRMDAARSTGAGGAGLGLAIAKEIIAAHGGNIYADSDGKQIKFTVELPN